MSLYKVFKTRHFARWMYKTELTDDALCNAVREMSDGLIDARLGAGLVKKRVGIAGRGKSGGIRTLVATNRGNRWFFVFGFAKNIRANISDSEMEGLQMLAHDLLRMSQHELVQLGEAGALQEICHDYD